eukprot:gene21135-23211_t
MATLVQSMPPFDPDVDVGSSVGPRWRIWLDDFETFVVANAITDDTRKRALLLFQAGPRVREIFRQLPNTGEAKDYKKAVEKLTEHFEPQRNKLYEVYKFRQAAQQPNETIDKFHTRLRSLAQSCEFTTEDMDFQIMIQIKIALKADISTDDDDDDDGFISQNDKNGNERDIRRSGRDRVQTRRYGDPVDSSLIP